MSNALPVWFLPPTRDRPPVAALRLGDIIASPWDPEERINDDPPPTVAPDSIRTRHEPSWSWTKEFSRSSGGGLFASFLSLSGIGPDLHFSIDKAHREIYTAEELVTQYFVPTKSYIEQSLQDVDVADALTGPGAKKRVYMITGIKTAYGATFAAEAMRAKSTYVQIGVDATSFGVPITIGPKGHHVDAMGEKQSAAGLSDFVFGYRLRELRYKKGKVEHKKYLKGALYERDAKSVDTNVLSNQAAIEVDDLDVQDVDIDDLDSRVRVVVDASGEEVQCVLPEMSDA
ncbi:hypothetical protein Slin15195_G062060 [Septoria linicola]|uniref:Uncharacterized protein n=1 Tax=Septoria linicola TaxID=215465 RepID=A0A9Q9AVU3_9PEZI|nr:hypothetical protein Slin14017_G077870 [Septoria linicola]USW52887.1 hypothetical protein Slin15195_G062060 [Septoria linicola]